MKFFSFWRSLASFRVRIALNLKQLPADVVFVEQRGQPSRVGICLFESIDERSRLEGFMYIGHAPAGERLGRVGH